MEKISWVVTPPCRGCLGPEKLRRRPQCLGCEKLSGPRAELPPRRLSERDRERRNRRISLLRSEGYSYARIARLLGIPRATVQSAARAAGKK